MLTDLQRKKLRHLFALYDVKSNGFLEREDYELFAHAIATERGSSPGSPEHERITRAFFTQFERYKAVADFSRDGRIEADEWIDFFEIVLSDERAFDAVVGSTVQMIFEMFDIDGDSRIDRDELASLRRAMRIAPASGADGLFEALDENSDGLLSVDEVRRAIVTFFRSDDPSAPANRFFGRLD